MAEEGIRVADHLTDEVVMTNRDPEELKKCPWSLRIMLGCIYKADKLGEGDYDTACASLVKWLRRDPALKREAASHLLTLREVDKKRQQKEFITRQQIVYLEAALSEADRKDG